MQMALNTGTLPQPQICHIVNQMFLTNKQWYKIHETNIKYSKVPQPFLKTLT